MIYTNFDSPVGKLLIAEDQTGLHCIYFEGAKPDSEWQYAERLKTDVIRQLQEYFRKERTTFDLPLAPQGTAFQKKVWDELCSIPYGITISYGELAQRIGNPQSVRAVGSANGKNPLPIVIPCHRVIGSNGTLTGYGGGLHIKKFLLELESNLLNLTG
jgi:methylated-DNA-[protein]-cysteine S-methyltransferase